MPPAVILHSSGSPLFISFIICNAFTDGGYFICKITEKDTTWRVDGQDSNVLYWFIKVTKLHNFRVAPSTFTERCNIQLDTIAVEAPRKLG